MYSVVLEGLQVVTVAGSPQGAVPSIVLHGSEEAIVVAQAGRATEGGFACRTKGPFKLWDF